MKQTKQSIFRMQRAGKRGIRAFVIGAVLLAVLIVVNVLMGALPAKLTQFDISGVGMTEISDETAKFLSEVNEDVTIYWLCDEGVVDDQFDLLLTRYTEACDRLTVEVIDPQANLTFTEAYTSEELSDYSLIIESARRYRVVDAAELYYYTNDFINENVGSEVPLTSDELNQYYSLYGEYMASYETHMYFQGETLITSAIDYVTKETIPHAYLLTGHGDTAPSDLLLELLSSMNVQVETINLQNLEAVPADAGCVILHAPENDISAHETTLLTDYLTGGGSLLMATSPANVESCPNIMSLGALFGLSAEPGLVREGDSAHTAGSSADVLVPDVSTDHYATYYVKNSGYSARMPRSHAISVASELADGVTVTPLFTTSEKASRVSLEDVSQSISEKGMLNVAVAATKALTTADGTTDSADLVWFASTDAFTDEQANNTSGGNYYYYASLLSWISDSFSSSFEALSPVSLTGQSLSGLTTGAVFLLGLVVVVVIPVGLLITGIVIWVKRKRR